MMPETMYKSDFLDEEDSEHDFTESQSRISRRRYDKPMILDLSDEDSDNGNIENTVAVKACDSLDMKTRSILQYSTSNKSTSSRNKFQTRNKGAIIPSSLPPYQVFVPKDIHIKPPRRDTNQNNQSQKLSSDTLSKSNESDDYDKAESLLIIPKKFLPEISHHSNSNTSASQNFESNPKKLGNKQINNFQSNHMMKFGHDDERNLDQSNDSDGKLDDELMRDDSKDVESELNFEEISDDDPMTTTILSKSTASIEQQHENLLAQYGQKDTMHETTSTFYEYSIRNELMGKMLPRKSGRYEDESDFMNYYDYNAPSSSSVDYLKKIEKEENETATTTTAYPTTTPSTTATTTMIGNLTTKFNTPPELSYTMTSKFSFVILAHPRGYRTSHVQCTLVRDRNTIHGKLYPTYEMILEETKKTIIIAQKMNLNRTSNYHMFDMTRGQAGRKLSKKNGNYLGKLRARNNQRTEYVLLNQSYERDELAGITFEKISLFHQLKDGNQPRRLKVMVPPINNDSIPIPHRTHDNGTGSILDMSFFSKQSIHDENNIPEQQLQPFHRDGDGYIHNGSCGTSQTSKMHRFQSKDPIFENGNYRLNFRGRVSMPSVKNFQLVSPDHVDDIICQFGKVDEDIFHLDYKAPLNAFQAFGLALCQFNL